MLSTLLPGRREVQYWRLVIRRTNSCHPWLPMLVRRRFETASQSVGLDNCRRRGIGFLYMCVRCSTLPACVGYREGTALLVCSAERVDTGCSVAVRLCVPACVRVCVVCLASERRRQRTSRRGAFVIANTVLRRTKADSVWFSRCEWRTTTPATGTCDKNKNRSEGARSTAHDIDFLFLPLVSLVDIDSSTPRIY